MEYQNIDPEYEEFKKESAEEFKKRFDNKLIYAGFVYRYRKQAFESNVVKKAKLLISDYCKSKHRFVFNEISARKGYAPGAPTIDLYDHDNRLGVELTGITKSLQHDTMIPRILRYKEIFGDCILVLLSYGTGNAWKPKKGITQLQPNTLERYSDKGIKVVFFDVDKPKFDWLE